MVLIRNGSSNGDKILSPNHSDAFTEKQRVGVDFVLPRARRKKGKNKKRNPKKEFLKKNRAHLDQYKKFRDDANEAMKNL